MVRQPAAAAAAPITWREWTGAVFWACLLTAVMTYPTVTEFQSAGRVDSGDGRFSIWNIGWIGHALTTDPRTLLDANIFHPHRGTLAYSELNLVAGVLGLPAFMATRSAIAAHNGAVLAGLVLSFLFAWLLARRLTGSSGAGLVTATAFTFCPFVLAHTAHIQLLMVFGLPLLLVAFHVYERQPGAARAALMAVALVIAALACGYYGIYGGIGLAVVALVLAQANRRYWTWLAGSVLMTGVLIAPVLVPYLAHRRDAGKAEGVASVDLQTYSADSAAYLSSPSIVHSALPGLAPAADSVFPGVLPVLLAGVGVVAVLLRGTARDRRVTIAYVALGVAAVWLSFGPAGGAYSVVAAVLAPMEMLRAPVRLGIVVMLAIAVLAAFGVRALSSRRPWVPYLLLLLVAGEFFRPWPLRAADPPTEAYEQLAVLPRAAVVELPFMYVRSDYHHHTIYMLGSTYHWQPLVNGYSDVTPPDFAAVAALMGEFPSQASLDMLRQRQVRYVVVHIDKYDEPYRTALLDRFPPFASSLRRMSAKGDAWLFEIVK